MLLEVAGHAGPAPEIGATGRAEPIGDERRPPRVGLEAAIAPSDGILQPPGAGAFLDPRERFELMLATLAEPEERGALRAKVGEAPRQPRPVAEPCQPVRISGPGAERVAPGGCHTRARRLIRKARDGKPSRRGPRGDRFSPQAHAVRQVDCLFPPRRMSGLQMEEILRRETAAMAPEGSSPR